MCEVSVKDPEAFYMSLQGKIKRNIMVISPPAGLLDSILDCSALKKKEKKGRLKDNNGWLQLTTPLRLAPVRLNRHFLWVHMASSVPWEWTQLKTEYGFLWLSDQSAASCQGQGVSE